MAPSWKPAENFSVLFRPFLSHCLSRLSLRASNQQWAAISFISLSVSLSLLSSLCVCGESMSVSLCLSLSCRLFMSAVRVMKTDVVCLFIRSFLRRHSKRARVESEREKQAAKSSCSRFGLTSAPCFSSKSLTISPTLFWYSSSAWNTANFALISYVI